MQYKPRPGIVQAKICGLHVLIPSRVTYDHCKSIIRLPSLWAITYDLIQKGESDETIIRLHQVLTKKSEDEIRQRIERFCENLVEQGFMIREKDEGRL